MVTCYVIRHLESQPTASAKVHGHTEAHASLLRPAT